MTMNKRRQILKKQCRKNLVNLSVVLAQTHYFMRLKVSREVRRKEDEEWRAGETRMTKEEGRERAGERVRGGKDNATKKGKND